MKASVQATLSKTEKLFHEHDVEEELEIKKHRTENIKSRSTPVNHVQNIHH